jgi:hypothetical protein
MSSEIYLQHYPKFLLFMSFKSIGPKLIEFYLLYLEYLYRFWFGWGSSCERRGPLDVLKAYIRKGIGKNSGPSGINIFTISSNLPNIITCTSLALN